MGETAYFRNIRTELKQSLQLSVKEIRIAVAWFTNQELFDILIECLKRGIKITLIIIDDYINNGDFGLDFQSFINEGGILMYGSEENPMHNKFCIIDENILLTGSYNWTYYAETKNFENIVKFEYSPIINQYIEEFENLKNQLSPTCLANKIDINDCEQKNLFSIKNYLSFDLVYKGKEKGEIKYIKEAANISPKDTVIQNIYRAFTEADNKGKLLVVGAKLVRNKRKSEFSNKDYAMYISCKMIIEDDAIGGREQIKTIFPDNSNHRAIFNAVNDAMKKQFGDEAKDKWKVLDNEAGRKADIIALDKPFTITGYMVKFRLPEGEKMLKTIGTGDSKRKVDAFFLDLLCIGESAVRDSNGDMIEAWGEVPESIYRDLKSRKVINVVYYDPKNEDDLRI